MKKLGILLGILPLIAAHVRAEGNGDRLQKVAADVRQALDARKEAGTPAREALPADVRAALSQLRGAASGGETLFVESALDQLAVYLDAGPVRQECVEMAATLRHEREAAEKKTLQDITSAVDRAAAAVRTAKTPAELDPIVSELGQFSSNRGEGMFRVEGMSSRPVMAAMAHAGAALRFVTQWQDYLSNMADGNREQGNQDLRSLSQGEVYLIPRSEILARMHEYGTTMIEATPMPTPVASLGPVGFVGPPVAEIVAGIKTLDDLAPTLDALDKISRDENDPRRAPARSAIQSLSPLDQVYRDFRAGQSTRVELPTVSLPSTSIPYMGDRAAVATEALNRATQNALLALRAQLLVLSLPRYLELPPETRAKPGEGPIDFLDRIRVESLKAGNYLGAARADETRAILRTGNQTAAESSQASQFISANRLETARQYALAVASYERALASGTELIPARVIGDRLDAIKAEHPQEFQQGMDLYLSPPPMRPDYPYYPSPMLRRPGMSPFGRPSSDQPEKPALSIPAATATPTAEPASPTPK